MSSTRCLVCSAFALFVGAVAAQNQPSAVSKPGQDPPTFERRAELPRPVPEGRKSIGLALGGGGAMGLAEIGVFKWMEEHRIPVDRLGGTSMGALVGGLYASGQSPEDIERLVRNVNFNRVFTIEVPYRDVGLRRRADQEDFPNAIQLGFKGGLDSGSALFQDRVINTYLERVFERAASSQLDYDTLPIPFRCIATDLTTLEPVVFDRGPMSTAVRASIALPTLFPPVEYHGHYLVDGAIMDNLPTDIVKRDLGADVIIAVDLPGTRAAQVDITSRAGIMARTYSAAVMRNEGATRALADILISVDTGKNGATDYQKADALINAGYRAAELNRSALEAYALDVEDWKTYLNARNSRKPPRAGVLEKVMVAGGKSGAQALVQADMGALKGHAIETSTVSKALLPVQASGSYQASFETFDTHAGRPPAATQAEAPDTGVLVKLIPASNGPPFLLLGADLTAVNANVTRSTFDLRVVDQDLGGFGSELRADLRLGFLTQAAVEYYHQLTTSGFFVQPHIGLIREPVYLWENQTRVSERLSQTAGGGIDVGRTFTRSLRTALEYRADVVRWTPAQGLTSGPSYSGTAQTATFNAIYNRWTPGLITPPGLRAEVTAGALFNTAQTQNAPLIRAFVARSFGFADGGAIQLAGAGDSYGGRNVAEPLRFTLGGPLRLSASSIDEYRGTDDFLVRANYLRKMMSLPSGFGSALYLSFGYEGGEMWSPERLPILRQDGVLMGIAVTPVGTLRVGGAIGDAGRRKVFLSFGRLF